MKTYDVYFIDELEHNHAILQGEPTLFQQYLEQAHEYVEILSVSVRG